MAKVQISRGRGRPDVMCQAITSFIRSKPWNGRNIPLDDILHVYSIQRNKLGKLAKDGATETKCANVQIQNMLRIGKLARVSRGVYTIPASEGDTKAKTKSKPKVKAPAVKPVVVKPNTKAGTEESK